MKPQQVVILGPTAAGKSSIALSVAKETGGCIVAVDSRTVYRGTSIGTAAPSASEREQVPHFNIGLLPLDEVDSPSAFEKRLRNWAPQNSYSHVVYCGGGTLYLQQLLFGSDSIPTRNTENTLYLKDLTEKRGKELVLNWLRQVDPEYAGQVDGFNPVRIYRALDVWMQTGKPFSSFHSLNISSSRIPLVFGINRNWTSLQQRIVARVDGMLASGLLLEVEQLLKQGYSGSEPGLNTVGYKEIFVGRKEALSEAQIRNNIIQNTQQYAKRQLTWFRRWPFIQWFDADLMSEQTIVQTIVAKMGNFRA